MVLNREATSDVLCPCFSLFWHTKMPNKTADLNSSCPGRRLACRYLPQLARVGQNPTVKRICTEQFKDTNGILVLALINAKGKSAAEVISYRMSGWTACNCTWICSRGCENLKSQLKSHQNLPKLGLDSHTDWDIHASTNPIFWFYVLLPLAPPNFCCASFI